MNERHEHPVRQQRRLLKHSLCFQKTFTWLYSPRRRSINPFQRLPSTPTMTFSDVRFVLFFFQTPYVGRISVRVVNVDLITNACDITLPSSGPHLRVSIGWQIPIQRRRDCSGLVIASADSIFASCALRFIFGKIHQLHHVWHFR